MNAEARLLEAAKQVKLSANEGDWSERARGDLLEMEKDLRGIAAVAEDRREEYEQAREELTELEGEA